ncbi:hypothetical protein CPT03_11995 [Pedobacter ginsengisoli]|uniref:Lipoprotein n=1 Tax=Pedobacter ginsengisoli TaxID=363852 RepID=A0A2D1U6D0_9SPHI|nr:hypothetical protein [Pedobacter ginsengisoli]ATP57142.1 hypothetical protein CPT03_11995 [Pedobacter ginsengisoli]
MKTPVLFLALIGSLILFSCSSSENKANNSIKDSVNVSTEQATEKAQTDSEAIPKNPNHENTVNLVKQVLNVMFKDDVSKNLIEEKSRKFKFFEYDLNDDQKKEILVGLSGSYFCGSGGCTILLLDSQGKLINKFTVTEAPVLITPTTTSGWKDLILHSNGNDHLVKYNGKTYPSNPSVQPVYPSTPKPNAIKGLDIEEQSYSW